MEFKYELGDRVRVAGSTVVGSVLQRMYVEDRVHKGMICYTILPDSGSGSLSFWEDEVGPAELP